MVTARRMVILVSVLEMCAEERSWPVGSAGALLRRLVGSARRTVHEFSTPRKVIAVMTNGEETHGYR
jgi:hypothetical protein